MAEAKKKKNRYIIVMDNPNVGIAKAVGLMEQQINAKITEGYVPHGNLVVTADEDGNPNFFQPMVLKSPAAGGGK